MQPHITHLTVTIKQGCHNLNLGKVGKCNSLLFAMCQKAPVHFHLLFDPTELIPYIIKVRFVNIVRSYTVRSN